MGAITKDDVLKAQQLWADGIVYIGKTFLDKGDFVQAATDHINNLYAYGEHPVLFKPTKAKDDQFRETFDKALSYFVASNGVCAEDGGFAITPWTNVKFENSEILCVGETAMAMGNYFFTTTGGDVVKVEYTFGYVKSGDGLKIVLHHSSIPYQG